MNCQFRRRVRLSTSRSGCACVVAVLVLVVALPGAEGRRRRRVRPQPTTGMLEIRSETKGAEVHVDGELVGAVPLLSPVKLTPGKHTLKMLRQGYTQYLDVFAIAAGKTTTLEIDLLPVAGVVAVTANVTQAKVYVDGSFVGTAPVEAEVLVGKRVVRVRRAGYHELVKSIKTVAGKRIAIQAKLQPLPVGATPYRPAPPPPPKWYEKWWVWASAAGGVTAVALAILVPVLLTAEDPIDSFGPDVRVKVQGE